jgi:3-isopropylmalate/(R)-2-methylmalate dehydratase large subunit
VVDAKAGKLGVPAVQPGRRALRAHRRALLHEYVTPMAESLFRAALGKDAKVTEPASVFAFRDHLTFLDQVMPEAHVKMGLRDQARARGRAGGVHLPPGRQALRRGRARRPLVGSDAICHNKVIEDIALPGQVVAGTDSHTCMAGVLGCFAFGVGSTDMANAWFTKDVRVAVPQSVRFNLHGRCARRRAKDVMLHLLAQSSSRPAMASARCSSSRGTASRR